MDGGIRTPNRRFWRPVLYQLSHVHSSLEMQMGRSARLRVPGLDDLVDFRLGWSGPVRFGTYMGGSSWLGSH